MKKSKVAIVRCSGYEDADVGRAISKGIELLGGISSFVKPNEVIVLKPNVLIGSDPAKCVTTHPAVFKAVARLLIEAGVDCRYGDSSGFGKCEFNMKRAKLKQMADELGAKLADFDNGRTINTPGSILTKKFTVANGVLDTDGLISLPKLKTHGLFRFTGAVKNQFGCIPGIHKAQFHLKLPDPYDFATMLVDLNLYIKPRLYIMDGIIAMEGNGPRTGKPRKLNVLLFSNDPVALDSVACKIININPEFVLTCPAGEKGKLGTYQLESIDIIGDQLEPFIVQDFDIVRKIPMQSKGGILRKFFKSQICPKPVIDKTKCSNCGTCEEMCPAQPKAIFRDGSTDPSFPIYNYNQCLRCFCCQELCPEGAITIKTPLLGKMLVG
jgi:uncharacterized protein (DUF362 family)/Pyruvate/2-oxoacid:ferredoxin oxidoreductase delta subunit